MSTALDEALADLSPEERAVVLKGLRRARKDPVVAARAFRGWTPHGGQAQVLRMIDAAEGKVKLAAISAGTGWGKTDCLSEMHSEVGQAKPGAKTLMASRSQDQADLGFKRMVASEVSNPISEAMVDRIALSPHPTLYRKNGSYTTSRTTKDNCVNLRGPEWDFITLDESAHGDEFAYQFLLTRVRKSNGPVILWSSPQEEWFADLWHELEDRMRSGDATVFAYRGPAQENPHLSVEFFERMRRELPRVLYEQEIEGKFVGSQVNTFRPEHLRLIFDRGLPTDTAPVRGHRYGLGWDLGVDATAAVGIALDCTDPNLILGAHIERHVHTVWPHVQRRVEESARAYPGRKSIDYTGVGKAATQNLRVHVREEEQFVFTGPSRYELCVDTMKWVEDLVERAAGIVSLHLPAEGDWNLLREQMRVHKLSMAKKKDSKSLGLREHTWDEMDSFMLAGRAVRLARSRGSLVEAA